jgi:hypothetical protein
VPVPRTGCDVLELGRCEGDPVRAAPAVSMSGLGALAATVGPLEGGELDS